MNKTKYIELWLRQNEDFKISLQSASPVDDVELCGEKPFLPQQNHSQEITIVYSDSASSDRDDFQSIPSTESPRDIQIEVSDSPEEIGANGFGPTSANTENFYITQEFIEQTESIDDYEDGNLNTGEELDNFDENRVNGANNFSFIAGATDGMRPCGFNRGSASGVQLVQSKRKTRGINKATLAQAALSAVMETEEPSSSPVGSCSFHKLRRTSSLNDNLFRGETSSSEAVKDGGTSKSPTLPPRGASNGRNSNEPSRIDDSRRRPVVSAISDHQTKKLIGHSRSKSEQLGMTKSKKQVVFAEPNEEKARRSGSFSDVQPRLGSSLPSQSGETTWDS